MPSHLPSHLLPSHLLVGQNRRIAWIHAILGSDRTVSIGLPEVSRCPWSPRVPETDQGSRAKGSKAVPGVPLIVIIAMSGLSTVSSLSPIAEQSGGDRASPGGRSGSCETQCPRCHREPVDLAWIPRYVDR